MSRYSIIIPSYNEEKVIHETYKRLSDVMISTKEEFELIFINDGSHDKTFDILKEISDSDKNVKIINFSRNFGHQAAVSAGMDYASGDAVVIIDADLQDPPEVILQMIEKWKEGYEVVYGKRLKRKGESLFKKLTAKIFYRFIRSMSDVDIPVDTGDFRLIDRKVCDAMCSISEKNRYIRGLVSWVGYKQYALEYVRHERFAGETKYSLKKMIKFASDGIISFSMKPLKLSQLLGITVCFGSVIYLIVEIIRAIIGYNITAVSALIFIVLFMNGLLFIMLGIIGEYISRIYDEAKNRPLYIVRDEVNFDETK